MTAEPQPTIERDNHRALWRSVILRACSDALGIGTADGNRRYAETKLVQARAQQWFREAGRDFRMVCEMAEMNDALVRKVMLKFISIPETDDSGRRSMASFTGYVSDKVSAAGRSELERNVAEARAALGLTA
ncbi:MAG: hypothetical protein KGL39_04030 [Patescibacteria group bacterium]|nr:hypothetical protein [Patescibacteria group bacterium]